MKSLKKVVSANCDNLKKDTVFTKFPAHYDFNDLDVFPINFQKMISNSLCQYLIN